MMQHPAIIALSAASLLTGLMLLFAGWFGATIRREWDLQSGSELQLGLERQTYLISTLVGYALLFQILSLFLFIFTADRLHNLFVGAMCAAGSLSVNAYGYPTLIFKVFNALLAGVWLIINHADTRGYDYPLVRFKYGLLNLIVPLVLLEIALQFAYFTGLKADVITSCCGSLFGANRQAISADIPGLPHLPMQIAFFAAMASTFASGLVFFLKDRFGYLFATCSFLSFIISGAALVSFICLYFYELPSHHCPFCILQKEYRFVGYALYATLLGGGVTGLGMGLLQPFRTRGSLARIIPLIQRRLVLVTLLLYLLFVLLVGYRMLTTPFALGG